MTFWYNTALIAFAAIAVGMTWTIMNSGFSSSEVMKDVVEDAAAHSANSLQIVGKMTGTANVQDNEVTVTATPVTATTNGNVNLSPEKTRVTYKIIKEGSHTITYDNIYVGMLSEGSYNSLSDALDAAKTAGLIEINPLEDDEKPQTTSAFVYWIIDQNSDGAVQNNEIASLVVVYADKDRPSTGEYLAIQVLEKRGALLYIERNVPNISSSILDFGGKVKT
jgi:flagellin FlaB